MPDEDIAWFLSAPSPDVVWGISHQNFDYSFSPGKHFVRTADSGATWTTGDINLVDSEFSTAIFAQDALTAWVGRFDFNTGAGSIWKTSDGGTTWAKKPIPFDDPFGYPDVIYFWDAHNGLIMGDPDSQGFFEIYTTRDGGQNWRRTSASDIPALIDPGEYGLTHGFDAVGAITLWFGTNFGRVYKTIDQGLTWTAVQTPMSDAVPYSGLQTMAFENERVGLALATVNPNVDSAAVEPKIIRTTDGGATWAALESSNSDEYNQKDVLLAIPGADKTYFVGSFNEAIGVSHNAGEFWEFDPTLASAGGAFFDPKTGWISSYHLGGTGGEILKFTGNLSPSIIRNITFQVDMGGVTVSPAGVHLAVDYFGWSPSAIPMTNIDNGLYEATIQVPAGTTLRYKFINGNAWGQNESVPAGCGAQNAAGSYDRTFTVGQWDARLPVTCFNSCISCGQTQPTGGFYCQPGAAKCEIFDWYAAGSSPSGAGGGAWANLGDNAAASVTGYYHGYTNSSGGRALRIGQGGNLAYLLGNPAGGEWEIFMRAYVPQNKEAHIALLSNASDPASSLLDLVLHTNRTVWQGDAYQTYPQNQWLDVKLNVNQSTGAWTASVNGNVVSSGTNAGLASLAALDFHAPASYGEFFVDDISVRKTGVGNRSSEIEDRRQAMQAAIYPNLASNVLFVPFDLPETGDLRLTLTDLSGRLVLERKLENVQMGVEAILLEGVANGIYLLRSEGIQQLVTVIKR